MALLRMLALAAFAAALLLGGVSSAPVNLRDLPHGFDPYAVLHVRRGADAGAIKVAYRRALNVMGRAASKHGHGQEASLDDAELMRRIGLAFSLLNDAAAKAEWDELNPEEASPTPLSHAEREDDM